MSEAQIEHFIGAVRYMAREGVQTLEPHPDAQHADVTQIDRRMRGTVWTSGGCRSWYLDRTGRNSTLWPVRAGGFTAARPPSTPRKTSRGRFCSPKPQPGNKSGWSGVLLW